MCADFEKNWRINQVFAENMQKVGDAMGVDFCEGRVESRSGVCEKEEPGFGVEGEGFDYLRHGYIGGTQCSRECISSNECAPTRYSNRVVEQRGFAIGIAVSGGSDSMALALLMHEYCTGLGLQLVAYTLDHQLRPESAEEVVYVKNTLEMRGIPTKTLIWRHDGNVKSGHLERLAREARYRLISEACDADGVRLLAVGHTLNDQVETYLLRNQKGSGEYGLAGISAVRRYSSRLRIIRPLLNLRKDELRQYLRWAGIRWVEDPSNESDKFLRVGFRKALKSDVELFSDAAERVAVFGRARACDDAQDARDFARLVRMQYGAALVDLGLADNVHIFLRFLRKLVWMVGGTEYPCSESALRRGIELRRDFTIGRCVVSSRKSGLLIYRENKYFPRIDLNTGRNLIRWDNRFLIKTDNFQETGECYINNLQDKDAIYLKKVGAAPKLVKTSILSSLPAVYSSSSKLISVPSIGYKPDGFVVEFSPPIYIEEGFVPLNDPVVFERSAL